MRPVEAIQTVDLFPPLSQALLAILEPLSPVDWSTPTACEGWSVKDVAAHLLGGSLGRLSARTPEPSSDLEPQSYDKLVEYIIRSNDMWVTAARRISPELLIEFLRLTDARLAAHFRSLPPTGRATIGVAWAGKHVSENWFDIAREYTEKWLHQQHIREAVGQPLLMQRRWLFPVLDTFLRGLPHAYRAVEAADGTSVTVMILGDAGGRWTIVRKSPVWALHWDRNSDADCTVRLEQDLAWRLFTNGVDRGTVYHGAMIEGNEELAVPVFRMVSIMA